MRRKDAQNSTLNFKRTFLFECSTSGGPTASTDLRVSDLVAHAASEVALLSKNFSIAKLGGGEEARTPDLRLAKPALCQLSYTPQILRLVAGAGFEPATFGL